MEIEPWVRGDAAAGSAPAAFWQRSADPAVWTLHLSGAWRDKSSALPPLPADLAAPAPLPTGCRVWLDGTDLGPWDAALAASLWAQGDALRRRGAVVELAGLPAGLRDVLALAAQAAVPPSADAVRPFPAPPSQRPRPSGPSDMVLTISFFGEVLIALGRWLRGRSTLRAADVLQQLDLTGPRSLPIVLLCCALIGLMLAYMGGAQLGRIGAQNFLADVVTVGMVRELGGMMTGIILAGRVGSAFAAQLATMQAGEEIDALRVLGVDPIVHLVLPRLLALMAVAPPLIALGAAAGIVAGWPAAVGAYGVSSAEYFHQSLRAITFTHVWIGLVKGLLYVALVALAGCREGLYAGRSAQDIGSATTSAVVKGLVWIVAAACATTVFFTSLGY